MPLKGIPRSGVDNEPVKRGRGRPRNEDRIGPLIEPNHRQLVEIMAAIGTPHETMARELTRIGLPCNKKTMGKVFADEMEHGKARRIMHYGIRLHAIAMGDTAQALPALRYMLTVLGGPQWKVAREDIYDTPPPVPGDGETVHIYMPPNGRDEPEPEDDGPTIDGEVSEAA